jgi:hypothetical protein
MPDYLKKYTLDCYKKGTFAYDARNIIRNKGKLTKNELQKEMARLNYKGTGGGYDATLHALEEVIGEIWMSGRGDDKLIVWKEWDA